LGVSEMSAMASSEWTYRIFAMLAEVLALACSVGPSVAAA
jgi:hypothetical protein